MMVVWAPYYCPAAMCCLSLPLLLLLLFCFCLCLCLLARVGVLGLCRGTALGHPCGTPSTGANNAVLLLKTWLAPDSTCTYLAAYCSWVERWDDGGESCAVLLCCAAAAVRVACVCFHRGHQKRCFIGRKCSRIFEKKVYLVKKVP